MKFIPLLLVVICFASCSNNEDINSADLKKFVGNYQIVSYNSDIEVDLNNDGIASTQLKEEINNFGRINLEIKLSRTNKAANDLISILLPRTEMTFEYPSSPEGYVQFINHGFGTHFLFNNGIFLLNNNTYTEYGYIDNVESNKDVILDKEIVVINSSQLTTSAKKEYYDFKTQSWKILNLDILFQRID